MRYGIRMIDAIVKKAPQCVERPKRVRVADVTVDWQKCPLTPIPFSQADQPDCPNKQASGVQCASFTYDIFIDVM